MPIGTPSPVVTPALHWIRSMEVQSVCALGDFQSVNDHGSGDGYVAQAFADLGLKEVRSFDIRPRVPSISHVAEGSFGAGGKTPADIVTAFHVLEHIPDSEWQQSLERGLSESRHGRILFVVPTVACSVVTTLLHPFAYPRNAVAALFRYRRSRMAGGHSRREIAKLAYRLMPINAIRLVGHGTARSPLHEVYLWRRRYYQQKIEAMGYSVSITRGPVAFSMHRLFGNRLVRLRLATAKMGLAGSMILDVRNDCGLSSSGQTS